MEDRSRRNTAKGVSEFRDRPYLFFVVRNEGKSRRWVFRYTFDGTVKKIEIGTLQKVSLADARAACEKHAKCLALPIPKDPKVMLEAEAAEAKDKSVTVEHYLGLRKTRNAGKRNGQKLNMEDTGRGFEDHR